MALYTINCIPPGHLRSHGIATVRSWMLFWMTSKAWRLTGRFSRNSQGNVYKEIGQQKRALEETEMALELLWAQYRKGGGDNDVGKGAI